MAARMPPRSAPSFSIASTVASTMPVSAPFHPACAAPITRAFGSTNNIGPQSAAVTPMARPSVRVTIASARGREVPSPGPARAHAVGRVALPHAEKMLRTDAHLLRHTAAIFSNAGGIVAGAEAAIEAGIDAAGYPALAAKERVTQAGNGRQQRRSRHHGVAACAAGFSSFTSLNPARSVMCGSETASTLNIE